MSFIIELFQYKNKGACIDNVSCKTEYRSCLAGLDGDCIAMRGTTKVGGCCQMVSCLQDCCMEQPCGPVCMRDKERCKATKCCLAWAQSVLRVSCLLHVA